MLFFGGIFLKTEKLSIFISIVLISILALGAVSAADDTAIADDASDAVLDEVQTIDNTIKPNSFFKNFLTIYTPLL